MSTFEHLFLDPGHADVDEAASELTNALELSMWRRQDGKMGLGTSRLTTGVGHVGGLFQKNRYGFPYDGPTGPADAVDTDFMIFDDMPLMWGLFADVGGDEGEVEQRRRARVVFDMIVARLGWRLILTHDFEELVATYDPEHGVREFPPGTPADGTARHLWGPAANE